MKISRVVEILDARILGDRQIAEWDLRCAICSDSMSDVLSFSGPDSLLLTGLTNAQSVRTAEMADIRVVCYVQGKTPGADSTALALEKGILLLSTRLGMYVSAGRLYAAGLGGCDGGP